MLDKSEKTLLPEEIFTTSSKEQVSVRPVPFGKSKIFSGAIASLLNKFQESGKDLKDIEDYKALFDVAFDEVIGIMGLVLDKPREWFDRIDFSDGVGILSIIISQNVNAVAKKNILSLIKSLDSALKNSSNTLSSPAMPGKISKDTQ